MKKHSYQKSAYASTIRRYTAQKAVISMVMIDHVAHKTAFLVGKRTFTLDHEVMEFPKRLKAITFKGESVAFLPQNLARETMQGND